MPATEETYRKQPVLHLVFALSSIAMLGVIVWMIMADHLRPWKNVQREFRKIETAKLEASRKEKLAEQQRKSQTEIEKVEQRIAEAEETERSNASAIREVKQDLKKATGLYLKRDTERKFQKAELDSQRSLYDGLIDLDRKADARKYVLGTIRPSEQKLDRLSRELEEATQHKTELEAKLADLRGHVDDWKKKRDDLKRDADQAQRILEQKEKQYGEGSFVNQLLATMRGMPGIDMAASPTKIQQISLPKLTINYNFKDVPRYDRCTTCHLGIDKINYNKDAEGKPMPSVFASHPFLSEGALSVDTSGNPVQAGLYLDSNGPHPINSFGCTICHGGQGSGTDFTYASHEPNTREEKHRWEEKYDYREMHHWDEPMLPSRFMQSSCVKCHHQVTDVPQADKLQRGFDRIVKYGCTGCHTIGGPGSFGPDLTDARQVGPNLRHIASKASKEWTLKWIKNPHAFRPDTRMPKFYGLNNNDAREDWPKSHAEIHAITHYLYKRSTAPPEFFKTADVKGNAGNGETLFLQKGCLACHSQRPYDLAELPAADRDQSKLTYKPDAAKLSHSPEKFPESVRDYAKANHGPNLSNIAAKFESNAQGREWLTNWIKNPGAYHPLSLMPNLQLTTQDAADIAAWLMTIPAQWPVEVEVPDVKSKEVGDGLNDLVKLYISKSNTYAGKTVLLKDVDHFVKQEMSLDQKLDYLGERTISRLGCFGCHNIEGFESAKPIGTPLNGWGSKSPSKLDYGHIAEFLQDKKQGEEGDRDGTPPYYQEKLIEHTRSGFLYQKLHRPRSYDYRKDKDDLKAWDDRLRMPQFAWANDPAAVEEVMTLVLGLTGEKIDSSYLPHYAPKKTAIAQGEKLLDRYNCKACHVLAMPKYTIAEGMKVEQALPAFRDNVDAAYGAQGRGSDYLTEFYPKLVRDSAEIKEILLKVLPADAKTRSALEAMPKQILDTKDDRGKPAKSLAIQIRNPVTILGEPFKAGDCVQLNPSRLLKVQRIEDDGTNRVVIEGMPVNVEEDEDEQGKKIRRIAIQLWRPATIKGYTFNVGDNITLDEAKVKKTEPDGGNFSWLYATNQAAKTGSPFADVWNRLPPPLLREGYKVQTPWLTRFLKDPYMIRPATNLRMPRFHYKQTTDETTTLANYFAAVDNAVFPYQDIPEREQSYLSKHNADHPNYLDAGWQMMAKAPSACLGCHAIGTNKPVTGPNQINGPELRQVNDRFRPDYLAEWLARPSRLVPYTVMPQNVPPTGTIAVFVPKTFEKKPWEIVKAISDTLLNYVSAVEGQLAGAQAPEKKAEPAKSEGAAKPTKTSE